MPTLAIRAHEEKYGAEMRAPELERRILSRYAGVCPEDVARLEHLAPWQVRVMRTRRGRRGDDGLPGPPARPEQLTFDGVDRMMRTNHGCRA